MNQAEIIEILNRRIFTEEKSALIKKISENPSRYVGLFRSTPPTLKLSQNVLQSREIRFGDALEEIIQKLISAMGFIILEKRLTSNGEDDLSCDQYFRTADESQYYLIEQKIRDDHDSTKKRGQIENFKKKLKHLKNIHGNKLVGIMYFIDPALHKNKKHYKQEISNLQEELSLPVYLFYNGELFQHLESHTQTWDLLKNSLNVWRVTVPTDISFNYDENPEFTVIEIAKLSPTVWYKLIANDALWEAKVLQTLFPTGESLVLLAKRFHEIREDQIKKNNQVAYAKLIEILVKRLSDIYDIQF